MNTNVKIPKKFKKVLDIYPVVVIAVGLFIILLVNIPSIKGKDDVSAQANYGTCHCEEGNLGCGLCEYSETQDFRNMCQEKANSTGEAHIAMCWTDDALTCEKLEGSVCWRKYTDGSGAWAYERCNNPIFYPEKEPEEPREDICPYGSTQARVQEDRYHHWYPDITIYEGESFRIGSFHNATGQFADDTRLEVDGPNGFHYECNASSSGCNGHTVSGVVVGTYILSVKTHKPGGGFYPESACSDRAEALVRVEKEEDRRGFNIIKEVSNGDHYYKVGEEIEFEIRIENTGEVVIEELVFIDKYDNEYLEYAYIRGERVRNGSTIQTSSLDSYIDPSLPDGEFRIDDLTEHLGDLGVDESFILYIDFKALKDTNSNKTYNYAIADDGIEQKQDDDWVVVESVEAPPTDR